jgi:hypothetical protein
MRTLGDQLGATAVDIDARIAALAGPDDEILVSSTVPDLVARL